jgi:MoaA/NifB/PqqE/SkfB family radical SAM enzyme
VFTSGSEKYNGRYPSRINFNFTARCNMKCPYCYVPFDGLEADLKVWKEIIDRVSGWEPITLTFAGGDPFKYKSFPSLLEYTKRRISFVHVDTNGLNLDENIIEQCKGLIDLMGLPLDGSTAQIHGSMRNSNAHFQKITGLLRTATEKIPVKINTVVSKINVADLVSIREYLRTVPPLIWSLYEFWPAAAGSTNRNAYELSHSSYLQAAREMRDTVDFASVEIGAISARKNAYFFVRHTGEVYVVDSADPNTYSSLGSVFNDSTIKAWDKLDRAIKTASRAKGRLEILGNISE